MTLSINQLPEVILEKILAYGDKKDLHRYRLVCKKWQTSVDAIHPHTADIKNSNENLTSTVSRRKAVAGIVFYSIFLLCPLDLCQY